MQLIGQVTVEEEAARQATSHSPQRNNRRGGAIITGEPTWKCQNVSVQQTGANFGGDALSGGADRSEAGRGEAGGQLGPYIIDRKRVYKEREELDDDETDVWNTAQERTLRHICSE